MSNDTKEHILQFSFKVDKVVILANISRFLNYNISLLLNDLFMMRIKCSKTAFSFKFLAK